MGLFDLFSNKAADDAAAVANSYADMGYKQLGGLYDAGRASLVSNYGNATNAYANLTGKYGAGADAYADASGANGVEGLARATNTFKNSGQYGVYGFGLDQGLQAIDRTHAAAGNLSSGGADTDATKYATGLAGNAWNSYQSGLQPYLGAYGSAVQGYGNAWTGLGNQLNASYDAQGNAANTNAVGQGKNYAAADLNNYNIGANQLNAILGAAQLAAGMPPTSFGKIGAPGSQGGGGGGNSGGGSMPGTGVNLFSGLSNLFSGFGGGGGEGSSNAFSFDGSAVSPDLITFA
jgi:hypothetical protein